jgi:hypothetical protein
MNKFSIFSMTANQLSKSTQPTTQSTTAVMTECADRDEVEDDIPYLVVKELGIKLSLTENTKDAYYVGW